MTDLPAGTVTFLFTDIEGSTKLAQEHPDTWEIARARHNSILQKAIESNSGYVFQIIGDAFCAAFSKPGDAIKAALKAQQNLQTESWGEVAIRVRMGIHTGEAETDGKDYRGYLTLSLVQRIMSAGHGGQILLSNATEALVHGQLPEYVSLRDMGEQYLKDFVYREHIFQLVIPGLPADFPPLKTLEASRHNLPTQLTSFIGREREMNEASTLLASTRLLTFIGSGGAGKTRLSLQVAAAQLPNFKDGIWSVELAPLGDSAFIVSAIASVCGLREVQNIPLTQILLDYLRAKQLLLILDNCEHLVEGSAQIANQILRACLQVKIIASSREALGIDGETVYRVQPLQDDEAKQLFIERAIKVVPRFDVTEYNASFITQICSHLDRIPLAIELAAARVAIFSPEEIATRLDDRFKLLTSGSRTALLHQQTLRALIDWSYDILSEEEHALFRRLAVFSGGWSFEAVQAVCPNLDVLSLLAQLINKSLVSMGEGTPSRYHLLETIRQYAWEKLHLAGEEVEIRNRHLLFFLTFSEAVELKLQGTEMILWLDRSEVEQENLRAALEWANETDPLVALRIVAALWFFWSKRASVSEGLKWVKLSLIHAETYFQTLGETDPETLLIWSRALAAEAALAYDGGDLQISRSAAEKSVTLSRKINDQHTLAFVLGVGAKANVLLGNVHEARAWAEEAIKICCLSGYTFELGLPLSALNMSADSEYLAQSEDLRKDALKLLREGENPWMLALNIFDSAYVAETQGDLTRAKAGFEESARLFDQMRDRQYFTACRSMEAHMHRRHSEPQKALMIYRQTILSWKDLGLLAAVAHELECFAFIAWEQRYIQCAAILLGAAQNLRKTGGWPMSSDEQSEYDKVLSQLHACMERAEFNCAWIEGQTMTMEQAIEFALRETNG